MKVKELINILSSVDSELEVKPYVKDLTSKIQFWYFGFREIDIKEDGVFIELD